MSKSKNIMVFLFIATLILIFFIFAFTKSYNPSVSNIVIIIFAYLAGMIYLFFTESKLGNLLEILFFDLAFIFYTTRIGGLASTSYCLNKSIKIFYFLLIYAITLNFIKQKEFLNNADYQNTKSNSVLIQSIFFMISIPMAFFTIDKIDLKLYTFIFTLIFFSFLLSIRKIAFFLK